MMPPAGTGIDISKIMSEFQFNTPGDGEVDLLILDSDNE